MLFSKMVLASETGSSTGGGGFLMLSFLQEMATKKSRTLKYNKDECFMVCVCASNVNNDLVLCECYNLSIAYAKKLF